MGHHAEPAEPTTTPRIRQLMGLAGYVACAAAIAYGLPHLWWGLGLSWAFPGEFADRPTDLQTQIIAYWVFGLLALVGGAVFALALVRPWGRAIPRWLLLIPAWIGAIGFTAWGLGFFYLQYFLETGRVVSAPEFAAGDAHPAAAWGYYWYGVFLIWGISLGAAAITYQRRTRPAG